MLLLPAATIGTQRRKPFGGSETWKYTVER